MCPASRPQPLVAGTQNSLVQQLCASLSMSRDVTCLHKQAGIVASPRTRDIDVSQNFELPSLARRPVQESVPGYCTLQLLLELALHLQPHSFGYIVMTPSQDTTTRRETCASITTSASRSSAGTATRVNAPMMSKHGHIDFCSCPQQLSSSLQSKSNVRILHAHLCEGISKPLSVCKCQSKLQTQCIQRLVDTNLQVEAWGASSLVLMCCHVNELVEL